VPSTSRGRGTGTLFSLTRFARPGFSSISTRLSRSAELIAAGLVTVDGRTPAKSERLHSGAMLDVELPAAHKKFPDVAPLAFPTREHEWGIQNAYIQAAADLGLVGLVLWLAPFALALVLALRANAPPGAVAAFTILAAMGIWGGQGLVAGIPLDAVTWLGFGLAATAAAQRSQAPPQGK
jgi:hypothetical protein